MTFVTCTVEVLDYDPHMLKRFSEKFSGDLAVDLSSMVFPYCIMCESQVINVTEPAIGHILWIYVKIYLQIIKYAIMQFDKVMIICDSSYISNINHQYFSLKYYNGDIVSYTFKQTQPYLLYIKNNVKEQKLIIEFTSKILLDQSYQLISMATIHDCLNRIVQMGICNLDIDNIIGHGVVSKCDVTMDVTFNMTDFPSLMENMRQSLKNYLRWQCTTYSNGGQINGIVIRNIAVTHKHKKRLCVYNKMQELCKAENRPFINSLMDKDSFIARYTDIMRFELNLVSMAQIRDSLDIDTVEVTTVLNAAPRQNPIYRFIDKVLIDAHISDRRLTQRDNERLSFIREHGNDILRIEEALRAIKPATVGIGKAMEPYRRLLEMTINAPSPKSTLLNLVA